jgi:hypothetical protein
LIEEMIRIKKDHDANGKKKLNFPDRILDQPRDFISWPSKQFDLQALYPHHPVFSRQDLSAMRMELDAALLTIDQLKEQVHTLTHRLHRIPGYLVAKRVAKFVETIRLKM